MSTSSMSLAAEANAVKEAYAALNRNDIQAFMRIFDPQIERIEPADFTGGGTYQGLEAVQAHVLLHRGNWAEGTCEPQRVIIANGRILVSVHVHVRLKNETEWREGQITDGFAFRNGKVIQWRSFAEERQARDWAAVDSSGVS